MRHVVMWGQSAYISRLPEKPIISSGRRFAIARLVHWLLFVAQNVA